jgi:hypothetical protein
MILILIIEKVVNICSDKYHKHGFRMVKVPAHLVSSSKEAVNYNSIYLQN